ncbi:MAG: hypothetical protein ACYS6K_28390 [Planctomycetota bacterium]
MVELGRRRRKVVRLPKRRLPKIFLCPNCSLEAVRVSMKKTEHVADATCGNCGMAATFTIVRADEPIDVYCKFTDKFYAGDMTVDA